MHQKLGNTEGKQEKYVGCLIREKGESVQKEDEEKQHRV